MSCARLGSALFCGLVRGKRPEHLGPYGVWDREGFAMLAKFAWGGQEEWGGREARRERRDIFSPEGFLQVWCRS